MLTLPSSLLATPSALVNSFASAKASLQEQAAHTHELWQHTMRRGIIYSVACWVQLQVCTVLQAALNPLSSF